MIKLAEKNARKKSKHVQEVIDTIGQVSKTFSYEKSYCLLQQIAEDTA